MKYIERACFQIVLIVFFVIAAHVQRLVSPVGFEAAEIGLLVAIAFPIHKPSDHL